MASSNGAGRRISATARQNNGALRARDAGAKPVVAKDQIAEFIRTRILEGTYSAGNYLSESMLQRHLREANLDFSRVPIREALGALEAEKLVEIVPSRGTFVCEMTPETIEEMFQCRLIVEQHVARQLALHPRINLREADELNRAMRQITRKETSAELRFEFMRLDSEFHCLLSTLAGFKTTFTELLRTTRNRFRLITFPSDTSLAQPYSASAVREHAALLNALRPRNRDETWAALIANARRAELAVRRHIQNSLKRLNMPDLDKQRLQLGLPGLFQTQFCSLDHDAGS